MHKNLVLHWKTAEGQSEGNILIGSLRGLHFAVWTAHTLLCRLLALALSHNEVIKL